MKIPFDTTPSEQDAVFSMQVRAEQDVQTCIANFFNGDTDAATKMPGAQLRFEKARRTWLMFCHRKYSKPAPLEPAALAEAGHADCACCGVEGADKRIRRIDAAPGC
ncbi:MAG: hypothetical protein JWN73_4259 [Betaproteobacteria bacterium]|nr:hypothetical protein [Betaproteobacteria bacterium]